MLELLPVGKWQKWICAAFVL